MFALLSILQVHSLVKVPVGLVDCAIVPGTELYTMVSTAILMGITPITSVLLVSVRPLPFLVVFGWFNANSRPKLLLERARCRALGPVCAASYLGISSP